MGQFAKVAHDLFRFPLNVECTIWRGKDKQNFFFLDLRIRIWCSNFEKHLDITAFECGEPLKLGREERSKLQRQAEFLNG